VAEKFTFWWQDDSQLAGLQGSDEEQVDELTGHLQFRKTVNRFSRRRRATTSDAPRNRAAHSTLGTDDETYD